MHNCINTEMGPFNPIEEISTDHSTMTRANMLSILLSAGSQCVSLSHARCGRQRPDYVSCVTSAGQSVQGVPSHVLDECVTYAHWHALPSNLVPGRACMWFNRYCIDGGHGDSYDEHHSIQQHLGRHPGPVLIFESLEKGVRSQVISTSGLCSIGAIR
jgi:hypothetical protein